MTTNNDLHGILASNHSGDLLTAERLGADFERAQSSYKKALNGGDQARISAAQIDLDKAQEELVGFMSVRKKIHDMIMRLLDMLRG